ncbi:ATP-binding protein [Lewinella sp. LCG006]|uniref:ATP-binding protein n=1 Tax=Lewinella sp. LCG006 TaxID=3231911 RepID=UPI00345FB4CD
MNRITLSLFLVLFAILPAIGQKAAFVDSLQQMLLEITEDSVRVRILTEIAYEYWWDENFDKALPYAEEALDLAEKTGPRFLKILPYQALIDILYYQGEFEQVAIYLPKLQTLVEEAKDTTGMQFLYQTKAVLQDYVERPDSGLFYYQKALALNTSPKDTYMEASIYNNIGVIYLNIELYDRARSYLWKSNTNSKIIENDYLLSFTLLNLGYSYLEQALYDSAAYYLAEAHTYAIASEFKESLGNVLTYEGLLFLETGQIERAEEALNEAKEIFVTYGYKQNLGSLLPYLADLKFRQGKFDEALRLAKEADVINHPLHARPYLAVSAKVIANAYEQLGDSDNAIKFLRKYNDLKDTIHRNILLQQLATLEVEYRLTDTEAELAVIKSEKEKEQLKSQLRTYLLLIAALLLLVVIGAVWYLYAANREKTNHNKRLAAEVAARTADLKNSNEQLRDYIGELQNFTHVTSHDLKEPLRNISGFTSLLERRMAASLTDETLEFMELIRANAQQMHRLIEGIKFYSTLDPQGQHELEMEAINLSDMMEDTRTSLSALLQEKGGLITLTGDLNIIHTAPEVLQLVLKNIIENGLKYNRSEVPEVIVKATATENNYEIAISDNGIGIAKEFQDQIFQMFKRLHTRQEFEGTGMGLAICKKIIRRLGGEISIESEEGEGSTFLVQLPR